MDLASTLDSIAAKTAQLSSPERDDYIGEDGLLYCGKCRTAKQHRDEAFNIGRLLPCLCKCATERREAEQRERERHKFIEQCNRHRVAGFPESSMQHWTFANDDQHNPKLTQAMEIYAERFRTFKTSGKGLLLYGDVGTGKTYAACCVANALIDRGHPVLVTNFARLVNTLQGMFEGKQQYIDSLNRFDLLVIDDLGAERDNEYMQEQVWNIIDARYRAQLPMIITSNLSGAELKNPSDISKARVYSRLLERCHPIEVRGADRRREALKKDHGAMRNILGI